MGRERVRFVEDWRSRITRSSLGAAVVALSVQLGCGGDAKPPVAPPTAASSSPAKLTPDGWSSGKAASGPLPSGRVPSPKLIDRRERSALASDSASGARSTVRPTKSEAEVYRAVAPATVIVRVPDGMGSGVIIDPAGWVLTNHHVIEHGEKKDFRVKATIALGHLDKTTGGMERDKKEYTAWVYKDDKLRDLALLKIEDPPKGLPFVPLATDMPVPGEHVVAIGHAGAGMLWAIKAGEISALGKLSEHLATLAQFKDDENGRKAEAEFKKYLDSQNLGVVIQSTCTILPGDSGGPLVTARGELVGLNAFSNKDPRTGGLLNFHVHLAEIAKFVADKPAKVARMVPDPWSDGGGDASYEDVDLDGKVDTLLLQGRRACAFCPRQSLAVFVDPDQEMEGNLPPLAEVYSKKSFRSELAYLQVEDSSFIWYDTDRDGSYDVLLVDEATTGRSSAGYRIQPDGDLTPDDQLASGSVIRMSLIKDRVARDRLQRIALAAFPERYVEASRPLDQVNPEPVGSTGKAETSDLDSNGVADSVRINATFSSRMVVDVDENSVSRLPSEFDVGATLQPGMLDAELSVVTQGTNMWVVYDTDDDGRFDLVLRSAGARLYVATDAFVVDAGGQRTPAPEHIGRKLVRPELLGALGGRMHDFSSKVFLDILTAGDDSGLASFPDPAKDHRGTSMSMLGVKGSPNTVVVIHAQGSDGYLVDLDQSSLRGKKTSDPATLTKLVEGGKVDAEFAYFERNGLAWAYYDTDDKDGYDVVLYTATPRHGRADRAFRVDKAGARLDSSLAGGTMVRPSLYGKKSLASKLKKLAPEMFVESAIER